MKTIILMQSFIGKYIFRDKISWYWKVIQSFNHWKINKTFFCFRNSWNIYTVQNTPKMHFYIIQMEWKERTIEKHIFVILQTRLVVKNTGLHDKRCLINLRLFIFMGHCKFVLKIQYEIKVYDQLVNTNMDFWLIFLLQVFNVLIS